MFNKLKQTNNDLMNFLDPEKLSNGANAVDKLKENLDQGRYHSLPDDDLRLLYDVYDFALLVAQQNATLIKVFQKLK